LPFNGAFSPLHWLIVAVVALMVLGPDKLPQAGREVARALRFVREARETITQEITQVLESHEDPHDPDVSHREQNPTDPGVPDLPRPWSS
jgi:TatA/E family protein of Tat protein translocase